MKFIVSLKRFNKDQKCPLQNIFLEVPLFLKF